MRKILLFISAFVPMYILFLINLIIEIINGNLTMNITNNVVMISLVILFILGIVGLMLAIKKKNKVVAKSITIVSKKNLTDQHFLNYFSLFVLLALTFDLSKICFVCVFVVIIIFIGMVYIRNNVFYINPLLNILGYSFYDITYKDDSGRSLDMRIFYRGEISLDKTFDVLESNRNLNFLIDSFNDK